MLYSADSVHYGCMTCRCIAYVCLHALCMYVCICMSSACFENECHVHVCSRRARLVLMAGVQGWFAWLFSLEKL